MRPTIFYKFYIFYANSKMHIFGGVRFALVDNMITITLYPKKKRTRKNQCQNYKFHGNNPNIILCKMQKGIKRECEPLNNFIIQNSFRFVARAKKFLFRVQY